MEITMYKITRKKQLNPSVILMDIYAPYVARKAQAGQFIILRAEAEGERIPLTVAGCDSEAGTVTVIFQTVGATTMKLGTLSEGDSIPDFAGPLGRATETEGVREAVVVGGGVGCAIALPVAKKLFEQGCRVHSIIGFRSKELLILEDEFRACSHTLDIVTDDGTAGEKGVVTAPLERLLASGAPCDRVFAVGPLIMMKFTVATARPFNTPVTVSMNPIMIDGTGMCGGCRLTVGGKTRFACVDGPEFNGYEVDFDEAMQRGAMYREHEEAAREAHCRLFK